MNRKPFTSKDGKRMFPMEAKQFGWLKPGDQFTTRNGVTVYTKSIDDMGVSEGESKFFPSSHPVIPLKHY